MAVIDRDTTSLRTDELEQLVLDPPGVEVHDLPPPAAPVSWSRPAMVLLATLSAAAGAIHLAMVPQHAAEWLPAGLAFAAAGWIQIGLAALLVARPSATALRASCLLNVVFVGAWLVTRIWGWPFGPEAFVPEAASFVDVTAVALEAVLVVLGYELLAKPGLGARLSSSMMVLLSIIPVGILVLATWAIASPSASNHAHGGDGEAAAGHSHGGDGGEVETAADGHDHGAAPVDDKGLSLIMNGAGEGGGHVHDTGTVELDAATQAKLDGQLALLQPLIEKYPTVADAEAAGYRRMGPYSPALGAHYAGGSGPSASFDSELSSESIGQPMLIFDGVAPDSKLAGFMYNIYSTDTQNPPEGFAGPNDHWHYHTNVCIVPRAGGGIDAPLGADTTTTQEVCDTYGGHLIQNTGYMVHVWPVPGYESEQGLFSNLNPKLKCADGTYYTIPLEEVGNRDTVCRDGST